MMKQVHLEIEGRAYIGIGDGDWLGTLQKLLICGWKRGWTTKDGRGRYWLVLTRADKD